jgi:PD-(D/E)XK nuclease superfamily
VQLTKPNLFEFATSELSQDAFLAWLLAWADRQYLQTDPKLHALGSRFLTALLALHEVDPTPIDESNIKVRRQDSRVDIVVESGDLIIAIEDKTNTAFHPGNKEALDHIAEKYPGKRTLPIYLKTGDQSSYDDITDKGIKVFPRDRLLAILQEDPELMAENAILADFEGFLEKRESDTEEWQLAPIATWTPKFNAWIGFYKNLKRHITDLDWKYVPNQQGGFLGAWWHWRDWKGAKIYLQISQGPLQFRLSGVQKTADYKLFCNEAFSRLEGLATIRNLHVSKTHLHHGSTMAIARIEISEWLIPDGEGKISLDSTLDRLRAAADAVDAMNTSR